jgi:hypothetical protein
LPGIARQKTRVNALIPRQSIHLRKDFLAKKMDARVKPAHDKSRTTRDRSEIRPPRHWTAAAYFAAVFILS